MSCQKMLDREGRPSHKRRTWATGIGDTSTSQVKRGQTTRSATRAEARLTLEKAVKPDPLVAEIDAVSRLRGTFKLRSGQTATEYFDKYRFESDPNLLRRVAQRMLPLLPVGTEVLAGLELGGVPIATAMSLESGLPVVFVQKSAKKYGTCQIIEGQQVAGRKVALVEDVITTGGAVADAVKSIRADVIVVVCAIWRGQGDPVISRLPDLAVAPLFSSADLT